MSEGLTAPCFVLDAFCHKFIRRVASGVSNPSSVSTDNCDGFMQRCGFSHVGQPLILCRGKHAPQDPVAVRSIAVHTISSALLSFRPVPLGTNEKGRRRSCSDSQLSKTHIFSSTDSHRVVLIFDLRGARCNAPLAQSVRSLFEGSISQNIDEVVLIDANSAISSIVKSCQVAKKALGALSGMWVSKKASLHEPKISLVDTRSLQDKEYLSMLVPEQFIEDFEGRKPIYYDHAAYSAHESLEYSKLQAFIANVAKCPCDACSDKGTYPKQFAATDPFPNNAAFSIDDALRRRSQSIDTSIHEREISTDASERTRSTDAKDVYYDPEETGSSSHLNTAEQDGSSVCSLELEGNSSFESLPSPPLTSAFRVQQSMESICIGDSHEEVGWFPKILQSINKRLCGTVGLKEVIDTEQVFL